MLSRSLAGALRPSWMPQASHMRSSSSRSVARAPLRYLTASARRSDIMQELDKQLNPRELIEQKRKAFEEKYGDKLKRKAQREGVDDVEALKRKFMAPSVKAALKAGKGTVVPDSIVEADEATAKFAETADRSADRTTTKTAAAQPTRASRDPTQAEGDRAGIKPLASILNLPLLHLTPHTPSDISKIWTAYHTTHPTLSSSYLSASLNSSTYASMLALAKANPYFVLPLPRGVDDAAAGSGAVKTDEYEMFFLQWLFHPTPTSSAPPGSDGSTAPLPPTTSVIFTPLEEYKASGEWAQPFLVLTHYPDLASTHDTVLMRGEISPAAATGPQGSLANPGFLLSQQQAQLLALALQRFYCAGQGPNGESAQGAADRAKRRDALVGFRERPQEWDWNGLVEMAYGGMI